MARGAIFQSARPRVTSWDSVGIWFPPWWDCYTINITCLWEVDRRRVHFLDDLSGEFGFACDWVGVFEDGFEVAVPAPDDACDGGWDALEGADEVEVVVGGGAAELGGGAIGDGDAGLAEFEVGGAEDGFDVFFVHCSLPSGGDNITCLLEGDRLWGAFLSGFFIVCLRVILRGERGCYG